MGLYGNLTAYKLFSRNNSLKERLRKMSSETEGLKKVQHFFGNSCKVTLYQRTILRVTFQDGGILFLDPQDKLQGSSLLEI